MVNILKQHILHCTRSLQEVLKESPEIKVLVALNPVPD